MHLTNRVFQVFIFSCLALPVSAYAESWSCSKSNDVREVHVERTTSAPVPCQVLYKKLTEGAEDQILWNANNDATYCEEKAQGLIAKLNSVGWVCTETIRDNVMGSSTDEAEGSLDSVKETATKKAETALDGAKEATTEKAKTAIDGAKETAIDDAKTALDKATDEPIH